MQVDRLSPDRTVPSHSADCIAHHIGEGPPARRSLAVRIEEESIGVVEKTDCSENRPVLPIGSMQSRLAPPHLCIIHRGKIIEDERGRVDHLDRSARNDERLASSAESFAGGDGEKSADSFASAGQRRSGGRSQHFRDRAPGKRGDQPAIDIPPELVEVIRQDVATLPVPKFESHAPFRPLKDHDR